MVKFRRKRAGLYQVGDITVEGIWHSNWKQYMWHVIRDGVLLESHNYLRDAKAAAIKLTNQP